MAPKPHSSKIHFKLRLCHYPDLKARCFPIAQRFKLCLAYTPLCDLAPACCSELLSSHRYLPGFSHFGLLSSLEVSQAHSHHRVLALIAAEVQNAYSPGLIMTCSCSPFRSQVQSHTTSSLITLSKEVSCSIPGTLSHYLALFSFNTHYS